MGAIQVVEQGQFAIEEQFHGAHRSVPLLGDDQFRDVALLHQHLFVAQAALLEFLRRLIRTLLRRFFLQIVFRAVDEGDDVRILLNRARLPQVGELGTLVLPILHLT